MKQLSIWQNGIEPVVQRIWLGIALGLSGVSINLVVTKSYARSEIYINQGDKEKNKKVFDFFYDQKEEIEKDFVGPLLWERIDDKITSRIKHKKME